MKRLIAISLCALLPAVTFAESAGSHKVEYDGGSIQGLKSGADLRLFIEGDKIRLMKNKKEVALIPANAVTELSYGQDVHRRIGTAIGIGIFTLGIGALMALSKSKKHYIGVTWDDAGKKGGIAFQADKSDYRGLLAGLEGITGKKSVNTDTMTVKN